MPDFPPIGDGPGPGILGPSPAEMRSDLVDILDSINDAVAADRSRVTTIQLVRARLKLQTMIAGMPGA